MIEFLGILAETTVWVSGFMEANLTVVSDAAGIVEVTFWPPTEAAAWASSLCRVTKRLVAPIEMAKPIMAACLPTRRLTLG